MRNDAKYFIADLHIHSKFSRATSKNLTPRNLTAWAAVKGIHVLATGDFTHPGWLEMISDQLEAGEDGFFRLKEPNHLDQELPWFSGTVEAETVRFVLCTEISFIYKKAGKVRKIHNLVFMPSLDAAQKFNLRLGQVGNLASDGRPILGLPARDLLEMVLETDPLAFLVPAHIWTPWFSLFGSKSGFNRLEDCFEFEFRNIRFGNRPVLRIRNESIVERSGPLHADFQFRRPFRRKVGP